MLYEASEDAGGELSVGRGDADDDLDPKAREQFKKRLKELIRDRAEAAAEGNTAWRKEINEETEAIEERLKGATGLGGKDRGFITDAKRARPRVTHLIDRAIKNITKDNPQLGAYLTQTIETGFSCSYQPDPSNPIYWEF